jgi:hypothetical protein
MTVGIAAICEEERDPKIVLAADRMITTGRNPQIEYEHTRSKIQTIYDNEVVSCMGVASGTVSFIEEFFLRLGAKLDSPTGIREIAQKGRDAYAELGRETVENQVLNQFDIELSDLSENQDDFNADVLSSLLSDVAEAQSDFSSQLEVLLGGVDGLGPHIYSIQGFDLEPQNTIGYHAVGSGTQPARSVFIRNEHRADCSVRKGLINTIEAKNRSEEARGVGTEMDVAVVSQPMEGEECCEVLEEEHKAEWVDLYEEIVVEETEAREDVINDTGLDYRQGNQQ